MIRKDSQSKLIGLTGNVACGKSTVAQILKAEKIPVVDADDLAKQVMDPSTIEGMIASAEIQKVFGSTDRKIIREIAFKDPIKKKELEAILHPLIQNKSKDLVQELFDQGHKFVVYDATLLVESGRTDFVDAILLITSNESKQLERMLARDASMRPELALKIIKSQMPQAEKRKHASWVIENNGTVDELKIQVKNWLTDAKNFTGKTSS